MSKMVLRTVPEAADQFRLSDRAVYELCRTGKLRHLRLGNGSGAIRIDQADIDAYQRSCIVGDKEIAEPPVAGNPLGDPSITTQE